jgi:chorismate dehydratase
MGTARMTRRFCLLSPVVQMLHIGEIEYANCLPIQEPFRARWGQKYRFTAGEPRAINRLLRAGAVDCAPASSIEYARFPDRYWILPGLSIGADGPARSVVLVTPVDVTRLDEREVFLTPASATSVVLLKILLEQFAGVRPRYVEGIPEDVRQPHLLIGDRAMDLVHDPPTGVEVVDLGRWWKEATDLPMVFALWLLRRDTVDHQRRECLRLAARLTQIRREIDDQRLSALAADFACPRISAERLLTYWRALSYELGDRHQEGLARFFELAVAVGAIPQAPTLELCQPPVGATRGP